MRLVGGVRWCCEREVDTAEYHISLTEIRSQVAVAPPLLTMPDTWNSEEAATRANSVAFVAEGDPSGLSFARCPTCPGLGRTPTLHVECTPVDALQGPGKDTLNADLDNKLHPSSSQPEPAQHILSLILCNLASALDQKVEARWLTFVEALEAKPDLFSYFEYNGHAWGYTVELFEMFEIIAATLSYPNCRLQQQLSSEGSEEEGPVVVDRGVIDGPPHQGTVQTVVFAASSNPGPSTPVVTGKRKAEAEYTEDGPVSPLKKNQKPAISESDKAVNDKIASDLHWKNHVPTIFGDLPDQPESSYGRGRCMQIQLQTVSASNLDVAAGVVELQNTLSLETFFTLCIPGFEFNPVNHEGGRILTPSTDERYESDPEGVGLGGLNTLLEFSGANADEPSSMDDDQLVQQF